MPGVREYGAAHLLTSAESLPVGPALAEGSFKVA